MKELNLSNIEREFILKAIGERKRLDGREAFGYRQVRIQFGAERGCCFVDFGKTKVMAQVSCEVLVPKDMRANEGMLTVNIELSPMAAPHFEAGRPSDEAIEMNRLLERCLRESRCLDTESLCIVAGLKVWSIRVDVHVLDYDGNIIDAASVAAISALVHFRRPDVTICGDDITIHSPEDRDPIPLSVHHMPLCTSFAFFDTGKFIVVDPTQREEMVADGSMVVAMNKHREICLLQMSGSMLLLSEQVLRCTNIASTKVTWLTELIQSALQNDVDARLSGKSGGFALSIPLDSVTSVVKSEMPPVDMKLAGDAALRVIDDDSSDVDSEMSAAASPRPSVIDAGTACIGEGGTNSWEQLESEMTEDLQVLETRNGKPATATSGTATVAGGKPSRAGTTIAKTRPDSASTITLSDSEEETVVVLGSTDEATDASIVAKASADAEPPATHTASAAGGDLIDLTVALKKKNRPKSKQHKQL